MSFMPYFPNREVNERYRDLMIWNWEKYKAHYVTDVMIQQADYRPNGTRCPFPRLLGHFGAIQKVRLAAQTSGTIAACRDSKSIHESSQLCARSLCEFGRPLEP